MLDQSYFGKFVVVGKDAKKVGFTPLGHGRIHTGFLKAILRAFMYRLCI